MQKDFQCLPKKPNKYLLMPDFRCIHEQRELEGFLPQLGVCVIYRHVNNNLRQPQSLLNYDQ